MEEKKLLIPEETYISCGVEIGTQQKTEHMRPFIARVRNDGLYLIDIEETDKRIRYAAKLLARYDPKKVAVVAIRVYAHKPIKMLSDICGFEAMPGRFPPGTFTNPNSEDYKEVDILLLNDPIGDKQAMNEAIKVGLPIVALCDTNNETSFVDLVIPVNNKGRKSLALTYWLLTREILKARGDIKSDNEFQYRIEDFEAEL
ncbi:MAG: 30S ribosomal protein S2 [Thermoplasmatales archaeon]|nr:30S ribosomal protein S2 [Thermoplasmatales archaeon]